MDTLRQDFAHALRALRQRPTFALTAIATLALGIAASTAIFSIVDVVLLRPLPYREAERLVLVWGELRARGVKDFPFPPGDFQDLREKAPAFAELAALNPGRAPLSGDGAEPEQVRATGVTVNLLPMLGARILHGRGFVAEDAVAAPQPPQPPPGAAPGAQAAPQAPPPPAMLVLTHEFWQRRYGGDPAAVGKTVDIGNARGQIVGVLAPGFELLWPPGTSVDPRPDVLAAMRIDYDNASRINVFLRVVGRLQPGARIETARAQAEQVAADLRQRFPIKQTADLHFDVQPMHADLVADVRPTILALMGAVVFVLLVACANVANLLLVSAAGRQRDFAVRAALGGGTWRLVRQLLVESLVLAGTATLAGVALAWAFMRALVALAPPSLPRMDAVALDPRVLGFAVLASVLSVALFGIVPALRSASPDVSRVLRAGGRTPALSRRGLLRSGVVVAEVALTLVLLVGGGLMLRSFAALLERDPGYDPANVLTFATGNGRPTPAERAAFGRQLADRLQAIPGVQSVTAASPFPLDGGPGNARWGTEAAQADPSKFQQANVHFVRPGYFETMRTRLVAGRTFTEADDRPEATGIVIDERLAAKAFPGTSAVGKRLLVRVRSPEPEWLEVVGVVAHQRHESLVADGREALFVTDGFMGHGVANRWALRTAGDPSSIAPAVRAVVRELEARAPVAELQPMQALVDRARAPTRFALVLIGVFAAIAALLAAVGLYGVLATSVRQRTAEIGVRIAIGAPAGRVFGLVIGEGLRLGALGILVGVVGALALTRVLGALLVDVTPTDPAAFALAVGAFLALTVVACWIPARRASRLDPTEALRSD